MDLKVVCYCGQKYKFDVEPVDGRMPYAVNCPVCGADGTPLANQLISQQLSSGSAPPPVLPTVAPAPMAVPASAITAPEPITPAPAPLGSGLRINRLPSAATPPPTISAPAPIAAPVRPGRMQAAAADPDKPARKPNFWMGLVGALLGAFVGSAICFAMCYFVVEDVGLGWRFLALLGGSAVTGYLAGAGAEFLGKGEGSKELGGIAAILAVAGIVASQYFVALIWWHNTVIATIDSEYGQTVKDARAAIAAIPTGSDDEIRKYLAKQESEDGDDVTANSITADQIKDFRENQLPELQKLASGQMTKAEYDAKNGINAQQEKKDADAEKGTFIGVFLLLFLRKTTILSLCTAAGLAYKISANA
jgi:hypothetical protein